MNAFTSVKTRDSVKTRVDQHRAACRLFQSEKSALAEHASHMGHKVNCSEPRILARQSDWQNLEAVPGVMDDECTTQYF